MKESLCFLFIFLLHAFSSQMFAQDISMIQHIKLEKCENIENNPSAWEMYHRDLERIDHYLNDEEQFREQLSKLNNYWFNANMEKYLFGQWMRDTSSWNYFLDQDIVHFKVIGNTAIITDSDTCYSEKMIADHYALFDKIIAKDSFSITTRWFKIERTIPYFNFECTRKMLVDDIHHFKENREKYYAHEEISDSIMFQEYVHDMLYYFFEDFEDSGYWELFNPSLSKVRIAQFKEEVYLRLRECFPNEFYTTLLLYFAYEEQMKWDDMVDLIYNWDLANQYVLSDVTTVKAGFFYAFSEPKKLLDRMLDRHKIDSQNAALTYHIALFYDQLGETKKAKKYFKKTVKLDSNYYTSFAEIALEKP